MVLFENILCLFFRSSPIVTLSDFYWYWWCFRWLIMCTIQMHKHTVQSWASSWCLVDSTNCISNFWDILMIICKAFTVAVTLILKRGRNGKNVYMVNFGHDFLWQNVIMARETTLLSCLVEELISLFMVYLTMLSIAQIILCQMIVW